MHAGVLTALVGAVGVLGWHKDAASAKTLYLVAVCVVALLALSLRTRVRYCATWQPYIVCAL